MLRYAETDTAPQTEALTMRVISGLYKGRILKTVPNLSVRPATDRVKQTLFDMLTTRIEFDGARVLDLFAGSGGLGIEALSRGASHVTFVEQERNAVEYLEQNLRTIGCERNASVIRRDAKLFLAHCSDTFDIVFADPPYAYDSTSQIPELIFGSSILAPRGYLLIEHSKDLRFEASPSYRVGSEKKFGRTRVTFFQHQP